MPNVGLTRTLILLKPDAVRRGLMGRILTRFEDVGLKIIGAKFTRLDDARMRDHYFDLEDRWGRSVFDLTSDYMKSGPVMALVLEGADAVTATRKLVGSTFPSGAAPGTIRGDYAHVSKAYTDVRRKSICNLVHASGTDEEAAHEIRVWFTESELESYEHLAEMYTF